MVSYTESEWIYQHFAAATGDEKEDFENISVNYAAETSLALAGTFLGDIRDRTDIYGTWSEKWKPMILERIPAGQLPPKYGGSKDWKPLPLN